MKMAKKALSLVLTLVMLVNVFAVMSSAAGSESAVDLYISTDKDVYAPGDEIVITVSEQVIEAVGDMWIAGQYSIGYDSDVVQPYANTTTLEDHGFQALQSGYDSSMSTIAFSDVNISMGDYIADSQASYGWDSMIMYCVAGDMATAFSATSKADLFTIKMKVKEDAPNGEYVIGFNQGSYEIYSAFSADATMGGIYGYNDDYGYGTAVNYGLGTCTFKVGAEEPAPSLTIAHGKDGIRYQMDDKGAYAGAIDVRTKATINAAELQALIGGATANDTVEEYILEAGFVYSTTDFAVEAAQNAAKTLADKASANGYTKKMVSYIQNDGTNYVYSCLVTDIKQADIATANFNAYAYIVLDLNENGTADADEWFFYADGANDISSKTLYNTFKAQALESFGWETLPAVN